MSSSGDGKLKLVFVHGFLGECSQTFKRFPSDLKLKLLGSRKQSTEIEIRNFNYESQGTGQVEALIDFLLDDQSRTLQQKSTLSQNKSNERIILLSHSMGGILAVDAIRKLHHDLGNPVPILGCIAFDTPYFGLAPSVMLDSGVKRATQVTQTFTQVVSSVMGGPTSSSSARSTSSSSSTAGLWAGLAAGVAAAAVTGFSVYQSLDPSSKEKIKQITTEQTTKISKSVEFLGPLWKTVGDQKARFQDLERILLPTRQDYWKPALPLQFYSFYQKLMPSQATFITPPPLEFSHHFSSIEYSSAKFKDEIDCHMYMFDSSKRDPGYSELLDRVSLLIQNWCACP